MAGVLILVPVLGRPHRVAPLLESLGAATPEPHRVLFIGSPGDHAEHDAVRAAGADLLVIDRPPTAGDYARKVNAGYRATDEPLLFLGADDLHFHLGWLTAATAALAPGIGVVGTNDLGSPRVVAGEHATHSLVTRAYADQHGTIDRPGQVLHEGYCHNFVDDELVATARRRHAWAFAVDAHVEHLHPSWGKAPHDATYARGRARFAADRRTYRQREALWT